MQCIAVQCSVGAASKERRPATSMQAAPHRFASSRYQAAFESQAQHPAPHHTQGAPHTSTKRSPEMLSDMPTHCMYGSMPAGPDPNRA